MSRNRIQGAKRKVAGALKEIAGKLLGDRKLQAMGAVEKAAGTVQNRLGKAQDQMVSTLRQN